MRAWLQKQKKKEDAKNASQPLTPVVPAPAPGLEAQQTEESADNPVQSVEAVPKTEEGHDRQSSAIDGKDSGAGPPADSELPQAKEVSSSQSYHCLLQMTNLI